MKPTRHKQPAEEGDDGQLWESERLDSRDVCSHHPPDCVLLLFQTKRREVFTIAPID